MGDVSWCIFGDDFCGFDAASDGRSNLEEMTIGEVEFDSSPFSSKAGGISSS